MTSMIYDDADPIGYGNVIFHHIPNSLAPSFQACLIVYAVCAGVMGLEIVSNLDYDFVLARRSGWFNWSKAPNRMAYFISRYFSFTFLISVLIFSTVAGLNCALFGQINQILWLLPLVSVDYIFIQRTMALYGWSRNICILLYAFYVIDVALAIAAVGWFGKGYTIPGSKFCAFYTTNDSPVHNALFIAYCVCLNLLDTLILLLTCHKLLEGGLLNIPHSIKERFMTLFKKEEQNRDSNFGILPTRETISSLLVRQGLHYYFILSITRFAYLVVYYLSTNQESVYQVLCTSILATVGPVLANRLFRETSEFVRARTTIRSNHNNSDDRIITARNNSNTLPMTMNDKTSYMMKPLRSNTIKSSSWEDDNDDFTTSGHHKIAKLSNSNSKGLQIYINERLSSFIDDFDDRAAPAGLTRLPQRHLSYVDPPQPASSSTSPISQRPFINTIPVIVESMSSSPSGSSTVQSPDKAFDIRLKRPDSSHQQWI